MPMYKPNMDVLIRQGYRQAHKITKKFARAFYFASFFLRPQKRRAVYSIYAVCRISDESVDDVTNLSDPKALTAVTREIESAYSEVELDDPLLLAFRKSVIDYRIPKEYFDELLKGMNMDLTKNSYANFDQLYSYCYRAAGVIGLVMLRVLGCNDPKAGESAVGLGVAMQLTNIIRDIPEDLDRGRVYLPQDEIDRFNLTKQDLLGHNISDKFIRLLRFQSERAREFYLKAENGLGFISDLRSRMVAAAIKELYLGILDSIERKGFDVFSKKIALSFWRKIGCLLKAVFIACRQ